MNIDNLMYSFLDNSRTTFDTEDGNDHHRRQVVQRYKDLLHQSIHEDVNSYTYRGRRLQTHPS